MPENIARQIERGIPGRKLPWALVFGGFVLIGATVSFALTQFRSVLRAVLVLCAPLLLVFFSKALFDGARKFLALLRFLKWWHGLWAVLFVSGLVFRIRYGNSLGEEGLDTWAFFRVALVSVTALLLLVRLTFRQTLWLSSMLQGLVGVVTAYGLICFASTLWSVYPTWTLYKSLEYLVDIAVLAAVVVTIRSIEEYQSLFDWTWTLYGLLLACVWLGALIWPEDALHPGMGVGILGIQLEGVWPAVGANSVGEFGAVLAIVALARLLRNSGAKPDRAWYSLLFAAALVTMVLAQARSAFAGFALGAILVLLFSKRAWLSALLASGAGLFLSYIAANGVLWDFLRRGESEREIQTLSGRVEFWQLAWQKFLEHPLIGYGAYAAGRSFVMAGLRDDPGSMHSEYMEVLVGTGLLGLVAVAVALFASWWCLLRLIRNSSLDAAEHAMAVEAVGVLGVVSVRSFFSPNMFWHVPLIFFVVLGYTELLRRRRLSHKVLSYTATFVLEEPGQ